MLGAGIRSWVLAFVGVILAGGAAAEPPLLVAYQGVLLAPDGSPRIGPVDIEVRIFDAPSGDNELYRETHPGVALADGVFSVDLGSGVQQTPSGGFSAELFAGAGARWLELRVGGEKLAPRQQFVSVPYSLGAAQVGGLTPAQIAATPGPVSGYERVNATSSGSATVVAACPPGKVLIGGGCDCPVLTVESRPVEGSNFWRCECQIGSVTNRAYALCADAGSAICGDGVLDAGEQCDSAQVAVCADGRCSDGCTCACGNGALDPGETCDGAANPGVCPLSLCAADCQCLCGNGNVDLGEQCDGASAAACPTGICLSGCTCQCGNGVCEDSLDGGIETPTNCPQDCHRAYQTCTSTAQCSDLFAICQSGYCTSTCFSGSSCNLDPGYAEFCAALPGQTGRCVAQCALHPIFGVYLCPNDLVCESINGGDCIAP